jgi:hypothetical protein
VLDDKYSRTIRVAGEVGQRNREDSLYRSPATIVSLRSETLRLYLSVYLPSAVHITYKCNPGQTQLHARQKVQASVWSIAVNIPRYPPEVP